MFLGGRMADGAVCCTWVNRIRVRAYTGRSMERTQLLSEAAGETLAEDLNVSTSSYFYFFNFLNGFHVAQDAQTLGGYPQMKPSILSNHLPPSPTSSTSKGTKKDKGLGNNGRIETA